MSGSLASLETDGRAGRRDRGFPRSDLWAVADQVVFGLSTTLTHLLLATWLEPRAYGAFTVVFSAFLLLGTFYTAVLVEPMLVFGAQRWRDSFGAYLRALLGLDAALCLLGCALCLLASAALRPFGEHELAAAFAGLAVALPFLLSVWLLRRASYVLFAARTAAVAGGVQLVLTVAGLALLAAADAVTPARAFVWLGVANAAGAFLLLRALPGLAPAPGLVGEVVRAHWRFGRWKLAAGPLQWIPENVHYLVLTRIEGLAAAAALRAAMNLVQPLMQLQNAVRLQLVARLARDRSERPLAPALRQAGRLLLGLPLLWALALWLFGAPVLGALTGGSYPSAATVLGLLAALPLAVGVSGLASGVLLSRERPQGEFWSLAAGSATALLLGPPLALLFGPAGAAVAMLAAYLVLAAVKARIAFHTARQTEGAGARAGSEHEARPRKEADREVGRRAASRRRA